MKGFIKIFLFPFAVIYDSITSFRNFLFDAGIFKTFEPPVYSIGVGNLSVGGTGKTPFVSYLIKKHPTNRIAVLSRGYGRKTKGYRMVSNKDCPETVGDEVFMLFKNHEHEALFFVSENRKIGVRNIMMEHPEIDLLIFDDVFQHRWVKPHFNIVLSAFSKPFFTDYLLPFGKLRESVSGLSRATVLVITKVCKDAYIADFKEKMYAKVSLKVPAYFTFQKNSTAANSFGEKVIIGGNVKVLCGLADNQSFINSVSKGYNTVEFFPFPDHYDYRVSDIEKVINSDTILPIVTTEKDFVKIEKLISKDSQRLFYIVKVETIFVQDEKAFLTNISDDFKRFQEQKGSVNNG